jgi:PAS domain S-box-containing protein
MPPNLVERFRDLQSYVGWSEDDAARIRSVAEIIKKNMDGLIDDFYAEIQRHPDALRVISGGQEQIARLMKSLRAWLAETLQCHSDPDYLERRWNIGLRHVKVGLDRAYTSVAMARLRAGVTRILRDSFGHSPEQMYQLVDSFNKLFDLELTIIQNAYQAESLKREKVAEHERNEVIFRTLVEAAACMVLILRVDESIAYFSPYCEELTGHRKKEAIGSSFTQLLVPEAARANVSATIAETFTGRPAAAYEVPIVSRDGIERWFVWNSRRLDDFEGKPAVLVVGQDITERREEQERLLRSERLAGIGQMITGIAHESRNALQRIQSCTEMLELEVENNPEGQRLVRRLQEAQDNLLRLFDEVRSFAAPIQLEKEVCRLDSVWREAWDSLEASRRERDAKLSEVSCSIDFLVSVDRFRMVQLFRNLLENSLAACSDPVAIQIECRDAQFKGRPAVELRVRDNGPGLSPKAHQSVFEPFFTTKTKGTGLGMAIARRIVEAHGGEIKVGGSSSPGAEFVITFLRANP